MTSQILPFLHTIFFAVDHSSFILKNIKRVVRDTLKGLEISNKIHYFAFSLHSTPLIYCILNNTIITFFDLYWEILLQAQVPTELARLV